MQVGCCSVYKETGKCSCCRLPGWNGMESVPCTRRKGHEGSCHWVVFGARGRCNFRWSLGARQCELEPDHPGDHCDVDGWSGHANPVRCNSSPCVGGEPIRWYSCGLVAGHGGRHEDGPLKWEPEEGMFPPGGSPEEKPAPCPAKWNGYSCLDVEGHGELHRCLLESGAYAHWVNPSGTVTRSTVEPPPSEPLGGSVFIPNHGSTTRVTINAGPAQSSIAEAWAGEDWKVVRSGLEKPAGTLESTIYLGGIYGGATRRGGLREGTPVPHGERCQCGSCRHDRAAVHAHKEKPDAPGYLGTMYGTDFYTRNLAESNLSGPAMATRETVCGYCGLPTVRHPVVDEDGTAAQFALCNGNYTWIGRPEEEAEVCDEDRRAIERAKGDQ